MVPLLFFPSHLIFYPVCPTTQQLVDKGLKFLGFPLSLCVQSWSPVSVPAQINLSGLTHVNLQFSFLYNSVTGTVYLFCDLFTCDGQQFLVRVMIGFKPSFFVAVQFKHGVNEVHPKGADMFPTSIVKTLSMVSFLKQFILLVLIKYFVFFPCR